jgi:hypothetical protein
MTLTILEMIESMPFFIYSSSMTLTSVDMLEDCPSRLPNYTYIFPKEHRDGFPTANVQYLQRSTLESKGRTCP